MKKQTTRRALVLSVLSLFVCVAMLVGTTFAWFTDSVTSGRNTIQSGNLDVVLEYSVQKNGVWTEYAEVTNTTDIFGYDNWEPGYTAIAKFRVTNNGSLALKYQLTADVYEETPGVNVANKTFYLSDFLFTEVVAADATRDEILASTTGKRMKQPVNGVANTDLIIKANPLEKGDSEEVALAIWMPTSVGNDANHNGTDIPSISFGINLIATQQTFEADSFDTDYDEDATYPVVAWAYAPIDPAAANITLNLLKANGGKVGSIDIPAAAIADDADNVSVKVVETKTDATVTVESDEAAKTFDITVEGIKDGNTANIKVELNVGNGLTGVKLYHKNQEITDAVYNSTTGLVSFYTQSFSPYTVVYDAIPVEEEPGTDNKVPVAIVTDADECENVELGWTGWGGYNPSSPTQQLDSVYLFTSPDTTTSVKESIYKDWYCDYYVMLKSDALETLPEGSITLGGNYGGYGWVGFDNPTVDTNTFIPLIGSVLGDCDETGDMIDEGWTYEAVVGLVTKFWCGVAVADGNTTDLSDAKFVVELRLTNPENTSEYIAVNTVTYTFATGESVIEGYIG